MYLEAVTVCVDYSDILALTIPYNKSVIDNWVIVTSTADKKTQGLCDYHKVKCITTDVFYESEDIFNKGKGVNYPPTPEAMGWASRVSTSTIVDSSP